MYFVLMFFHTISNENQYCLCFVYGNIIEIRFIYFNFGVIHFKIILTVRLKKKKKLTFKIHTPINFNIMSSWRAYNNIILLI